MKKTLSLLLSLVAISAGAIDFSGTYECVGYDTKDGTLPKDGFTISSNKAHSYPEKDQYAYDMQSTDNPVTYMGSAISSKNNIAMYFMNVKNPTSNDNGVAIILADVSSNGEVTLDKRYYEQQYVSDGWETCKKLSQKKVNDSK